MRKPKFSLAHNDDEMLGLVHTTDQKTLAVWAIDCAERVLPCFEQQFPASALIVSQPCHERIHIWNPRLDPHTDREI